MRSPNNGLYGVIAVCVTAIVIALIVMCFQTCQHVNAQREKCIAAGHSATDCHYLFNLYSDNR